MSKEASLSGLPSPTKLRACAKINSSFLVGGRNQGAGMPRTPKASPGSERACDCREALGVRGLPALYAPLALLITDVVSKCGNYASNSVFIFAQALRVKHPRSVAAVNYAS